MDVRTLVFVATASSLVGCGASSAGSAAMTGGDAGPPPCVTDAPAPCATVKTRSGPVEGTNDARACSYMGIPYAAPPTGALRWKAPQPVAQWAAPRPSKPGSSCPQGSGLLGLGVPSTDEDCLYLNVWVPDPRPCAPAPVMIFVHGGGFTWGAGSSPLYDGARLANATGAIVVTMNYRLGPFGFLSSAALRAEDPSHPSAGNYGLEDQIASFQWVKTNIAAFGGDPTHVTVFGESAGGTSMFDHLASPKSRGLFEHMIVESGWCPQFAAAQPQTMADQSGVALATALGCTDPASLLSCMRGKSAADVLNAMPAGNVAWFPVVDGFVLQEEPLAAITAGGFNEVPTILGDNANEGTLFQVSGGPTTAAQYEPYAEALFPGHGAQIVAQYPVTSFGGSYQNAAAAFMADGQFVCPARRVARGLVKAGVPTYRYEFRHAIQFSVPNLGAFHGSELLFVFGNPSVGVTLQGQEVTLSQEMMGYWGAMTAGGDPNGGGRLAWPTYEATSEKQMVLDLTLSTESAYERSQCDFWDGIEGG